jgi:hypothetical protein
MASDSLLLFYDRLILLLFDLLILDQKRMLSNQLIIK